MALFEARRRHAPARRDAPRRGAPRRPEAGGQDYLYPAWQFAPDGKPLPVVPRLVAAGREVGLSDDRLYEVLASRAGLAGSSSDRLVDALREGRDDYVLGVVRAAT